MISSGTLVATVAPADLAEAMAHLGAQGIVWADIGEVHPGKGVKIIKGQQETDYTDIHPEVDELARMWKLYGADIDSPSDEEL